MKKNDEECRIQLKAYTTRELAEIYEISEKVMRQWIALFEDQVGKKQGRYYTPKQAKIIFEKLGIPEIIILN